MNVREAEKVVSEENLNDGSWEARGFLQCHELYKPLAEALEYSCPHSSLKCGGACESEVKESALAHYRTHILGEKE